ncbi:MAG: hypothetical protein U0Y82_03510 [Thermoleophilia bacterium]
MEHNAMRDRFDLEAINADDPFELDDGNLPHLAKHHPFTAEDALEGWAFGDPLFYPALPDGPADWLMVARIPGGLILVPLAPARSGEARKCRPIGIYEPSAALARRY